MARKRWSLWLWGLLLEGALLAFLATGVQRSRTSMGPVYLLPFAIYLLVVWRVVWRGERAHEPNDWLPVLFFTLLFHATLLVSPTPVSDDIFRYEWDGLVTSEGINPYAHSPAADEVRHLRGLNWHQIQNKTIKTMYPPLAQLLFGGLQTVWPGTMSLRVVAVLFSVAATGVIMLILKELRLEPSRALIYGWSPLAALEFGNSGHIDALAVLCMMLCFLALLKKRPAFSGAALALGALTKIFPLLFVGVLLRRWGKRGMAAFGAVFVVLWLPFLGGGWGLVEGSSYFVGQGLFNGSLFPLLRGALRWVMDGATALLTAKVLVFVGFVVLSSVLAHRSWRDEADVRQVWRYALWLTGGFLLLSPTVHPWYLTWVLPFLCVTPYAGWIVLTGTSILARFVYVGFEATGVWQQPVWTAWAEYLPAYALLAFEGRHRLAGWWQALVSRLHWLGRSEQLAGRWR